jgi:RNA polymerase primary sigma factor
LLLRTIIADYREPAVDSLVRNKELRQTLDRILSTLTSREQQIIRLRYGLDDGYSYTLEEMGRIIRCSRERVRGIEAKAIAKLSAPRQAATLLKFIDADGETIDLNDLPYSM